MQSSFHNAIQLGQCSCNRHSTISKIQPIWPFRTFLNWIHGYESAKNAAWIYGPSGRDGLKKQFLLKFQWWCHSLFGKCGLGSRLRISSGSPSFCTPLRGPPAARRLAHNRKSANYWPTPPIYCGTTTTAPRHIHTDIRAQPHKISGIQRGTPAQMCFFWRMLVLRKRKYKRAYSQFFFFLLRQLGLLVLYRINPNEPKQKTCNRTRQ